MATYAIADLHGRLDLLNKVKQHIKQRDKVYVLGDCGDRGPDPWATIKGVITDPRFIYLKGNHEQLLIDAAKDYLTDTYGTQSMYFLLSNGGKDTFKGFVESENPKYWLNYLQNLPLEAEYKSKLGHTVHLSHAGYTPGETYKDFLWDREHCFDEWPKGYDNYYIIHGHTPIQHCKDYSENKIIRPYIYANGHKIDIDLGAYISGKVCLLNLDTFEYELIF